MGERCGETKGAPPVLSAREVVVAGPSASSPPPPETKEEEEEKEEAAGEGGAKTTSSPTPLLPVRRGSTSACSAPAPRDGHWSNDQLRAVVWDGSACAAEFQCLLQEVDFAALETHLQEWLAKELRPEPAREERQRKLMADMQGSIQEDEQCRALLGEKWQLCAFGSAESALHERSPRCDSDDERLLLDVCLMCPGVASADSPAQQKKTDVEVLTAVKNALLAGGSIIRRKGGHVDVIRHARMPVLKFHDMEGRFDVALCINNCNGVRSSQLLREYMHHDRRVCDLVLVFQGWLKRCGLRGTRQKFLSSYAAAILCVHFLQNTSPPVLPLPHEMPAPPPQPQELNDHLLSQLFVELLLYMVTFDYTRDAMGVLSRGPVPKQHPVSHRMELQDPFERCRKGALPHNPALHLTWDTFPITLDTCRRFLRALREQGCRSALGLWRSTRTWEGNDRLITMREEQKEKHKRLKKKGRNRQKKKKKEKEKEKKERALRSGRVPNWKPPPSPPPEEHHGSNEWPETLPPPHFMQQQEQQQQQQQQQQPGWGWQMAPPHPYCHAGCGWGGHLAPPLPGSYFVWGPFPPPHVSNGWQPPFPHAAPQLNPAPFHGQMPPPGAYPPWRVPPEYAEGTWPQHHPAVEQSPPPGPEDLLLHTGHSESELPDEK